jgi:photosystem II stability/assembly factor-like uncharacterized protein
MGQWEKTNGPYAGTGARCFTSYNDNLYAGTESNGAFLSVDSGASWQTIGNELHYEGVLSLHRIDSTLLAGTYYGLYSSRDNGVSWDKIKTGIPTNRRVYSLIQFDNIILAGTDHAGIYRSTDNAKTWTEVHSGLATGETVNFVIQGGRYIAAIYLEGLFSSEDSGKTWQPIETDIRPGTIRSLAVHNEIIFSGTLFSSPDSGKNWFKSNEGITETVNKLISMGPYIFAGTDGSGVFRSEDDGKTWLPVNEGLTNLIIKCFYTFGSSLYVSTLMGVFETSDFGESWHMVELRFTETTVNDLIADGDNIYAATYHGIFKSPDRGSSWIEINNGLKNYKINALLKKGSSLYAATQAGLYYSLNNGLLWQYVNFDTLEMNIRALAKNDSTVFAAGSSNTIFASSDDGLSWNRITLSSQPLISGRGIGFLAADHTNLFIGKMSLGVYRLNLTTYEQSQIDFSFTDTKIHCLYLEDKYFYAGTDEGVLLSTDNGNSWTVVNDGIPDYWWYGIIPSDLAGDGEAIVVATGNAVAISWDHGTIWRGWKLHDEGYPSDTYSKAILYQDSTIFMGTTLNGVWNYRIPDDFTEIRKISSGILQYKLNQNYPNPFNPVTTIQYSLYENTRVSLIVYNINGQKVRELINDYKPAGSHLVTFDGSDLASGVYFYRIQAGDFIQTRRMLLIK